MLEDALKNGHCIELSPTIIGLPTLLYLIGIQDTRFTVYDAYSNKTMHIKKTVLYNSVTLETTPAVLYKDEQGIPFNHEYFTRIQHDRNGTITPYISHTIPESPYTIEDWYAWYLGYMIDHEDVPFISYEAYVALGAYWSAYIPHPFLYPILTEALKQGVDIAYIYPIIMIETGGFRYFRSLIRNRNGSNDYGLMGINDSHFKRNTSSTNQFLYTLFYSDGEWSQFDYTNELHILKLGIRYLKSLIRYTGTYSDALICYNSGISSLKKNTVTGNTRTYMEKAKKLYNLHRRDGSSQITYKEPFEITLMRTIAQRAKRLEPIAVPNVCLLPMPTLFFSLADLHPNLVNAYLFSTLLTLTSATSYGAIFRSTAVALVIYKRRKIVTEKQYEHRFVA
jgi:hypothetical protein